MTAPRFSVEATIQIHAATGAVWEKFCPVGEWPRWNPEIVSARWLQGPAWEEGSVLELRHCSLLGRVVTTRAVVRMAASRDVSGRTVVWESQGAGMVAVHTAQFSDNLGGCRLYARHTYHGWLALLLALLRGRQEAKLRQAMAALKAYVEQR